MILAVDPGLKGAFTLYNGISLQVRDMPTLEIYGRRYPNRPGILDHLRICADVAAYLLIEKVGGIPAQSAHGAFTFGHGCGYITGAADALGFQVHEVPPMVWKSALKVPADKGKAIERATELLPAWSNLWADVRGNGSKDQRSGRAEAALIALYGWKTLGPVGG